MPRVSAELPEGWKTRSSWMAMGPRGPDGFAANISVERRGAEPSLTARELYDGARSRLAEQRFPALERHREVRVEVAGVDAVDLEFTHDADGPEGPERFTRRLVCLVKDGDAYEIVLTATTAAYRSGDRERFERFLTTLEL